MENTEIELSLVVKQLRRERDEARDVARKMLRIARARGPEPFGLTMVPWLLDPPSDEVSDLRRADW